MKKFIVNIGPDTLLLRGKSKRSVRQRLNKLASKRIPLRNDHLYFKINSHVYCRSELLSAEILTVNNYLKSIEGFTID